MAEDADEPLRVLGKDVFRGGADETAPDDEAVHDVRLAAHRRLDEVAEGEFPLAGVLGDLVLQVGREALDALAVAVIVPHEGLDAAGGVAVAVTEIPGHRHLLVEVQQVRRAGTLQVQFRAHAQKKVVRRGEFLLLRRIQIPDVGEVVHRVDAEPQARHPDGVVVVAHAADAVLDVGFLQKEGVAVLVVALLFLLDACVEVGADFSLSDKGAVTLLELLPQFCRTRDKARLKKRVLALHAGRRLGQRLLHVARGMPDLEAEIPERIQNVVGHRLLQRLNARVRGVRGIEEHDVHVAVRAHFLPPVAAEGDEGEILPRLDLAERVRAPDEVFHEDVHHHRTRPCHAQTRLSLPVVALQKHVLLLHVLLVRGKGCRHVAKVQAIRVHADAPVQRVFESERGVGHGKGREVGECPESIPRARPFPAPPPDAVSLVFPRFIHSRGSLSAREFSGPSRRLQFFRAVVRNVIMSMTMTCRTHFMIFVTEYRGYHLAIFTCQKCLPQRILHATRGEP